MFGKKVTPEEEEEEETEEAAVKRIIYNIAFVSLAPLIHPYNTRLVFGCKPTFAFNLLGINSN